MKPITLLFFVMILTQPVFASFKFIPLKDLVRLNDIIVVGTLQNTSEHTLKRRIKNAIASFKYKMQGKNLFNIPFVDAKGTIIVHETLWGDVDPGTALNLTWSYCPGLSTKIDHKKRANIRGIWKLTSKNNKDVKGIYFDSFLPLNNKSKVIEAIKNNRVGIQRVWRKNREKIVSIIFRNPQDTPLEFPGIKMAIRPPCYQSKNKNLFFR